MTSEVGASFRNKPGSLASAHGTLSVISISKAAADPAASVVATVDAGCQPVRVITSADGRTGWVGEAPVGLALVNGGSRIVIAGSDRFNAPGASATLAVVDVPDALAGQLESVDLADLP